jgi:hypothetical protein
MNEENSPLNERSKVILPIKHPEESVLDVSSLPKKNGDASLGTENIDQQWASLRQDWQSQPYEKVDVKALLGQTQRRTFWAKFLLTLDIVATIFFIIAVVVMWLNDSQDTVTIVYLAFGAIASIIFVYFEVKIRLAAWQQVSASPELAIDNAIKAVSSSIKYIQLIKFSYFVVTPLGSWYVIEMALQADKAIWQGLLYLNVFVLIMWLFTQRFYHKRQKEIRQLKQINSE